jgi:hypothetical protein
MLTVISWCWKPPATYRSQFNATHVNTLKAMVARHYRKPHRFVCVTDMPHGMDCETIPLWPDHSRLMHPHGARNPSCYRRLKIFSPEAEALFGKRFVSMDLDCVITDDLSPLWDTPEDFKIWGETNKRNPYNGSMFIMTAGSRRKVWDDFNPSTSPNATRRAGFFGSDQAWLALCLGNGEARWTKHDGVYSFRNQIKLTAGMLLPKNAKVVFFHGQIDPWTDFARKLPWVREHYR